MNYLIPELNTGSKYFLRQGDLDGACGFYSLVMALLVKNVITTDMVADLGALHGKTRLIGLMNLLRERKLDSRLFGHGLSAKDIVSVLNAFQNYPRAILIENGRGKVDDLRSHIVNKNPVIVAVQPRAGYGHWVLAVGFTVDITKSVTKILVRDPGESPMQKQRWNNTIVINRRGLHTFNGIAHRIGDCVAIV